MKQPWWGQGWSRAAAELGVDPGWRAGVVGAHGVESQLVAAVVISQGVRHPGGDG